MSLYLTLRGPCGSNEAPPTTACQALGSRTVRFTRGMQDGSDRFGPWPWGSGRKRAIGGVRH